MTVVHVLAVDDDIQALTMIQKMAKGLGCSVETVNGGGSFMAAFIRRKPDVVVIDLVMPDMDGIELIQWLRDIGCNSRLVIASGEGQELLSRMATAIAEVSPGLKVSRLAKPFSLSDLRAALLALPAAVPA